MAPGEERPDIDHLDWDEWTVEHIVKHGVTREEVEEAVAGETMARATYKNRLLVLGPTRAGRMLAVVIGEVPGQPGAYYIFSARPASRPERRLYHEASGGEKQ